MSDDFDFELDLPPKVDIKPKKSELEKESSKPKLSLMDKLALLKKGKQPSNDEPQEKVKESNEKKTDNSIGARKENENKINPDTGNVSNLQKILNKIKSNNDSLKKQGNLVSERKDLNENGKNKFEIDSKVNKFEGKISPSLDKAANILDSVKINENFDKDFKEGKKLNENKSIQLDLNQNHNESEKGTNKNSNSYLNLYDSIQEIEDINDPPVESKNNREIIKNENILNAKIKSNSEIEKVIDNINLFSDNKKVKPIEQQNKINEDSLEILITESNLNEIELIEEKKDDPEKKNNAWNNNNNNDDFKEEQIEVSKSEISKGSFDMDTDEENEKKDRGNNKLYVKHDEMKTEIDKNQEIEKSLNNSDLINNLLNKNNNINEKNPQNNNLNPSAQRYSNLNLNDSKKNDDFNISQNLVNLSNEIQEYKSSEDVSKMNSNFGFSKDISAINKNDLGLSTINKENKNEDLVKQPNEGDDIRKSFVSMKNESLFNKDVKANQKDNFPSSNKKLNDSLLEIKNNLENVDKSLNNKIQKENTESDEKETPAKEQENIKDLFKLLRDESDEDNKSEEKSIVEIPKSLNKEDPIKNDFRNELISNKAEEQLKKSKEYVELNKIKRDNQLNNQNKDSILDIDDIPEIEEKDEEDGNIVNLDEVEEAKNIFSKPDNEKNNVFNKINKNYDSLGILKNNKDEGSKLKEKADNISKIGGSLISEKNKKQDIIKDKMKSDNEKKYLDISINQKEHNKINVAELVSSKRPGKDLENIKTNNTKEINLKTNAISTEIIPTQENIKKEAEKVNLKTEEIMDLVNKKNNKVKEDIYLKKNESQNLAVIDKNNINKNPRTEESCLVLESQQNETQVNYKPEITNEIQETELNIKNEKEIIKTKKNEIPNNKDKKNPEDDNDKLSVASDHIKIDSSKFKIFIDFNDPDKVEQHLNEILGTAIFNGRVKEKNIRFLLRRKSVIKNEMFTSFTLREYNLINKIKKVPYNYSSKVEQILNEYQNESDYDNLFKKAIGDDNNNKQNLIKLLQKDKIKDKSFYLFDNISCLYSMEAFAERFNLANDNFLMDWDASRVIKRSYDEEDIIHTIYKKKDELNKDNLENENKNNINNHQESEQKKILKSDNDNVRVNSMNDDFQSKNDNNKMQNTKNNLNSSKIIPQQNSQNDSMKPYNLTALRNEIKCWRESISDGDSFYRMFMFSLIEYYILNKNLHEIKKILFDVNRVYETSCHKSSKKITYLFSSKEIDYSIVVIIFNLIIEALKKGQIEKAYDTLLNAYNLEDKSFDLVLIGYMRIVLWHSMSETQSSPEVLNLENNIKGDKSKKDYEEVNIDTINTYQLEPYKLSLNLASSIFNVNLDIIYLDSTPIPNVKHEKIKSSKVRFNNNSIHETPTINLLYNFSCYGKYYTNSFYEKNKNIFGKYYSKVYQKVSFEDKFTCDKCGKKTKKVILKKYDYASCLDCLKNYLELILFERVKYYEIENFLSREYYCRPIAIKQKFIVDDYDYLNIFGFTLSSHIMDIIRKCCFACDLIKTDEPIYNLDCTCNYCKTCLNAKISDLTNSNFVLNTFEKNIYLNSDDSKRLCGCNTIFDIESALKALKMNVDNYRKNANKRLDEIVAILCMKCGADSRSNEDGFSHRSNSNFTVIKIKEAQVNNNNSNNNNNNQQVLQKKNTSNMLNNVKDDEFKYISVADHVLCVNCIDDYSRRLVNNKQNYKNSNDKKGSSVSNVENKSTSIFCNICEAEHSLDAKSWSNIVKQKACCRDGCEIF